VGFGRLSGWFPVGTGGANILGGPWVTAATDGEAFLSKGSVSLSAAAPAQGAAEGREWVEQ
jgi:hypothetical protein